MLGWRGEGGGRLLVVGYGVVKDWLSGGFLPSESRVKVM